MSKRLPEPEEDDAEFGLDGEDFRLDGPKPSSPVLICQVANLPEQGIDLQGTVPFHELGLQSDERFDLDANVTFRLHVAPVRQDIIVTGSLQADILAACDRCMDWAPCHLETRDVFHCYKNPFGEPVDLTDDVREDILLVFPQSFHCREDCKGLCPTCGHNLNQGPCDCQPEPEPQDDDEDPQDSPWQALDRLELP